MTEASSSPAPDVPVRSYLYAPASNDRILAKVLDRGADAVILDLEDGVAASAKAAARSAVAAFLAAAPDHTDRPRLLVRVNRDGGGWSADDLDVAVHPATGALVLPKAESAEEVDRLADAVGDLERRRGIVVGATGLHLLVESAVGVEALEALARSRRVVRFGLGAADLLAELGATGGADHAALDHVRGRLVVASRAAGLAPPVDSVHTTIDDLDGLRASAERGRAFGFFGKAVIHPSHVAVVNDVLTPGADEVDRAARIVAAADQAEARGQGAVELDGAMLDLPVVARARQVLVLAELASGTADTAAPTGATTSQGE